MDQALIFAGLTDAQREAVGAVRGPVCILAGAGSGKTTTITRRIANQVATSAFRPDQILAVTFTDRAAGEMRSRLRALGAPAIAARTFHSAALAQLRHLSDEPPGALLPSKGLALRQLANSLPKPYRFRPAADLASEIEWAKNRRISPGRYLDSVGTHTPPIPADLMHGIYDRYEKGKSERGLVDFEDLIELAIKMFERDEYALEVLQNRYLAFTVDEYQDVNPLQQALLDCWLGPRDDICAVGDDYQSIYGFTGASPEHLLSMPARFPRTKTVRLEDNFRSTPQVLELANRLVPTLGGAAKHLRAARPSGPPTTLRACVTRDDERAFIVDEVTKLADRGIPFEDMAILYRVNFRSEDYEEALVASSIPFQARDGAFLRREAARRVLPTLKRSSATDVAVLVRRAAEREGFAGGASDDAGEREVTRQHDLARLIRLADEFDDGSRTGAGFVADLEARFSADGEGRGVNLLTYHRVKGLEFEVVFLPSLEEGEIPFKRAKTDDQIAEERRLLYVGMTRAKSHLLLSWTTGGRERPSRFVLELGGTSNRKPRSPEPVDEVEGTVLATLKAWRLERSRADRVPAYVVLHDTTLQELARRRPASRAELAAIQGIGPAKLDRYGDEVLAALASLPGG